MYNSFEITELLKKNYEIKVHQHDALFTVEDSIKLRGKIDGAHSKNLFLKNKKIISFYYHLRKGIGLI